MTAILTLADGTTAESVVASLGRHVVSATDATRLGELKGVVLDSTGRRIEALHVAGRAKHAELLPWSEVEAFGPDAVIARAAGVLTPVADEQQSDMVRGRIEVLGGLVLGCDGFERGTVTDVLFDPSSGALMALLMGDVMLGASAIRSLGHYCWVVDDGTVAGQVPG